LTRIGKLFGIHEYEGEQYGYLKKEVELGALAGKNLITDIVVVDPAIQSMELYMDRVRTIYLKDSPQNQTTKIVSRLMSTTGETAINELKSLHLQDPKQYLQKRTRDEERRLENIARRTYNSLDTYTACDTTVQLRSYPENYLTLRNFILYSSNMIE